jgi:hypothetical protein
MVLSYENKDAVELYTKEKSQIDQNTY